VSTVRAIVVRYKLRAHPNADALSIADIESSAWQVVVRTEDFAPEGTAIYIPVDAIVPETEEFEFLRDRGFRIKAIRLRGEYSYGLLMPNKESLPLGEDVTERMGIKKYEPPVPLEMSGEVERGLDWVVKYTNIERYENFPDVLKEGEEVVATEKIHGSNLRVSQKDGRLYVGGRNYMFKESERNLYWSALKNNGIDVVLLEKLADEMVFYGEVYGSKVQNLHYGLTTQKVIFYDAFLQGRYLDWNEFVELIETLGLSMPPLIYKGFYQLDKIKRLAQGTTLLGGEHIREGLVVKPVVERFDSKLGRVIMKFLNPEYETSKGRTDHH
jgi:RNA ligase (TIGR02306 family)